MVSAARCIFSGEVLILAVTRFSGREAPKYSGAVNNIPLRVMQESYSHEVSSAGFWPGNEAFPHPAFYSYAYPTPADFGTQKVLPVEAFYSKEMGEFLLLYDDVRKAAFPEKMLMEFLQSTYDAAAEPAIGIRSLWNLLIFKASIFTVKKLLRTPP